MPNTKNSSRGQIPLVTPQVGSPRSGAVSSTTLVLSFTLVLFLAPGCSKEELNQALESAKSKTKSLTSSTVEAVEEIVPVSGEVILNFKTNPIKIANAEIDLIRIRDGRPNVVQITTYDPDTFIRSYPILLLHGITHISTATSLAGETIQCDVYYQERETSPIAMTLPGEAITFTFQQYNPTDQLFTASLGMISLHKSDGSTIQVDGGNALAVLREENK